MSTPLFVPNGTPLQWWAWDRAVQAQVVAGTSLSMSSISLSSTAVWDQDNQAWTYRNIQVGDEILSILNIAAAGVDLRDKAAIVATNTLQLAVTSGSMVLRVITQPQTP